MSFAVEVTRGNRVESMHYGRVAVVDAAGRLVFAFGDVEARVFPRSAVKALQALPLIETGAADRYGLTPAELALACSSHNGEPGHVATAAAMLARAGRDASVLECGAHWPYRPHVAQALARAGGTPTALHNNCSGKHAGFVCLACHAGDDPAGYTRPDHPVQVQVKRALEEMAGVTLPDAEAGIDGCSIPAHALPLRAIAHAFARFTTGMGLAPDRAAAARRLSAACAAHPDMVAGEGRFCTEVMAALGARVFVKTGAEGVFCAAFPEAGLGVALKCEDGASRAAEVMMAELIARFVPLSTAEAARLDPWRHVVLRNWNGTEVGRMHVAAA